MQRGLDLADLSATNSSGHLENLRKDNNLDNENSSRALKQEGLTIHDLRRKIERSPLSIASAGRDHVEDQRDREEARSYFESHPTIQDQPASRCARCS